MDGFPRVLIFPNAVNDGPRLIGLRTCAPRGFYMHIDGVTHCFGSRFGRFPETMDQPDLLAQNSGYSDPEQRI